MDWHTLSSSSEDDDDYVTSRLPIMECTEWSGLALNEPCRCEHGPPCERFVAFQSIDTGRRFLACAKKDASKCNFVKWVDREWPIPLKQGLTTIWSMYEENLKVLEDKRKIENDLRSFKIDFAKMVADKEDAVTQLGKAHRAIGDLREELEKKKLADKEGTSIHQVLRAKAEKERDQMKQEKAMWVEEMEQMKQEKGKWVDEREQMQQEKGKWVEEREEMEQDKAKLKLEKRNLEYSLRDLFYDREAYRNKIMKLQDVLDE